MGTRLDALYPADDYKWLNYKQIDKIVKAYKEASSEQTKAEKKAMLLRAFHTYFMKYVSLLKGTIGALDSNDTISFLALFLTGDKRSCDYFSIYKYVKYICRYIDDTDIYNELVVMFLQLLDKFEFVATVSFSRYITQYMRWSIKAWIMDMARNPLIKSALLEYTADMQDNTITTNDIELFYAELPVMNLAWVANTSSPLFSILSRYERQLLYLSYKEGLGIRQIGERLGRAKDTIHSHLQQALQKLREYYRKGE